MALCSEPSSGFPSHSVKVILMVSPRPYLSHPGAPNWISSHAPRPALLDHLPSSVLWAGTLAPQRLHLLFLLPRKLSVHISVQLTPSPPSNLCSNATLSVRFLLTILHKTGTPGVPSLHSLLILLYFSPSDTLYNDLFVHWVQTLFHVMCI